MSAQRLLSRRLLTASALLAPLTMAAQQGYNVVYIMTDDHTAQMLSAYDTRYVQTPNLDRIAQDGVKFTRSFVANSLSGPSRACMLTGKHSHKNGFTNNEHGVFDGSQQTMPKLLQAAGYETAMIGKWHLYSTPTGFDHWDILPGHGNYYNPDFINPKGTYRVQGYLTDIITDKAIHWLEAERNPKKNFALFVHHKACHRNWLPDLKHLNAYEDQIFDLPPTFRDDYANRPAAEAAEMRIGRDFWMDYDNKIYDPLTQPKANEGYLAMIGRLNTLDRARYDYFHDSLTLDFKQRKLSGNALDEYKYQRYMRDYAKVLKSLDENVGRLLDYLQSKGMLDNTLVVYTSDQGFYMGEHGWFDKRFMYEQSLNTPLLMHLPKGFKARGDIQEMVQNIDYAPTFLELAGAPIPSDIQGRSLLPLLRGEHPKNWRRSIYYHFYEYPAEHSVKRHFGVRTERYKLIRFYNDIDCWELYDLKNDPDELTNLYGRPGTERITRQLKAELLRLQKQYDDSIRFTVK